MSDEVTRRISEEYLAKYHAFENRLKHEPKRVLEIYLKMLSPKSKLDWFCYRFSERYTRYADVQGVLKKNI